MIQFKDMISPVECIVTEETSLEEAICIMKEKKWNLLPVTDKQKRIVGIFTRTKLYEMILHRKPLNIPIKEYIIKDVETIRVSTPYAEIERLVQKSKVGTGVVLNEEDCVIGLLTKTDMVMSLLRSANSLREQLEKIVQHSNMGVVMTNEKKEILYANERISLMIEKDVSSIIHQNILDVIPQLELSLSTNQTVIQMKVNKLKTVLYISPYQTAENEIDHIVLFQDLSEIESMATELQTVKNLKTTLETAIDYAYDGIVMIDEKMRIEMVSPSLLELFDLSKNEVLKKDVNRVLPHFELEKVFQSETAEVSEFMEINGIKYIVHRIPILQEGKCIGAIGKVMFRQLNEVSELFKKLQKVENKASNYHDKYQQEESAKFTWESILSLDSYMEKLKKSAAKAAKGRSTVLIRGESGTGKELFAHAIHNSSARSDGKFVVVNCAAIPEDLLESEFFGYEEGAFTGAKKKGKIGKFDLANGGTLFLDEIGDMSLSLQAKLLRVLQEREFYRVGGTKRIQVDVRIIAATNRHLEEMVTDGQFREDLYYRLNVISLNIPPLRDRLSDIDFLIGMLMKELNSILGTSITGMENEAKFILQNYNWPGNVRELRNVMERAMTFAEHGKVQVVDLPDYILKQIPDANSSSTPVSLVEDAEKQAIQKALKQTEGNKAKAARILGISRSGLYEKIKKYELSNG